MTYCCSIYVLIFDIHILMVVWYERVSVCYGKKKNCCNYGRVLYMKDIRCDRINVTPYI